MKFKTLPGFRNFYPNDCAIREYIFSVWKNSASAFGFVQYDSPTLEPLDLFKEKSGDEISDQLFCFKDKGGRQVALRPEMTPSLAKLVGEKANSLKKPLKWYSIGEQFRYERPQKGRLRSFYQFNVDIIGEEGIGAEVELLSCLVHNLNAFGLRNSDFGIFYSDRILWVIFLKIHGVKDQDILPALALIDRNGNAKSEEFLDKIMPYLSENSDNFLNSLNSFMNVKNLNELKEYFNDKDLTNELNHQIDDRIKDLKNMMVLLDAIGLKEYLNIDLSIVRGLAYYTGFVFEVFEQKGKGRALAGGGRYDNLIKKLTGNAMSAVGFAMGDVTLMDLLNDKNRLPKTSAVADIYIIFSENHSRTIALSDSKILRMNGVKVDYPLKIRSFSSLFKFFKQSGIRYALLYSDNEIDKGLVKLIDLKTGKEEFINRSESDFFEKLYSIIL